MSTISFPDWINSLSPQSTDGKEVYQQDGSTPSRGDLDDKASLSGGSAADFDLMPWVDGSPIVEEDSNDDGEFVRFANGTQICSIYKVLGSTGITSPAGNIFISSIFGPYTWAKQFISPPIQMDSGGDDNLFTCWFGAIGFRDLSINESSAFRFFAHSSRTVDGIISISAIGNWK